VTAPSRIGKPQNYQTAQQNIVYSGPEVSVTGKALWYIESHLGEELSLDTIACAVGVSRFHLSRVRGFDWLFAHKLRTCPASQSSCQDAG